MAERGVSMALAEEVKKGRLSATTDLRAAVSTSEAIIIAVQTPYEGGKAILSHLSSACDGVASAIKNGTVVIVESTVPPGTCQRVVLPIFGRHGKRDGSEFYFGYCPERIAPGNSLEEFTMNDRIVGAGNDKSRSRALETMKRAVKGKLIATNILTAETTKLVENAARDVYIAFANDLAKMSSQIGVDAREVISLANTHPRVKILNPGPGVGGPCLTKVPYLLLDGLTQDSGEGTMIRAARSVNNSMSEEVVRLATAGGGLNNGDKVAVLGTSYKPDIDDPRNSPSEPVIRSLIAMGYDVLAYDPKCKNGFGARIVGSVSEATSGARCALFLVAHSEFATLNMEVLASAMARNPVIVDAVGLTRFDTAPKGYALRRLGDGRRSGSEPSVRGEV